MLGPLILGSLLLVAAAPPADTIIDGARSERIDELFEVYTDGEQPGAAAMVIHDGRIVHAKGYGYANLEREEPLTPTTSIRLGSVTKQFVCMAILILYERGELDIDDPVTKHVPELAERYGHGITIRHLMNHTSGLPDYYNAMDEFPEGMPRVADGAAVYAKWGEPRSKPGEKFEYSNPGYEMLALIAERVSGQSFAQLLAETIFEPLEMEGTLAYENSEVEIPNRAYGYQPTDEGYALNDDHRLNWMMGAGGIYSTLEDMYRWDQALYTDSLVSPITLEEAFTPATLNDGSESPYGFGWSVVELDGHPSVQHGGGWVGFRTVIARFPDERLSIVVLSNRGDCNPGSYVPRIAGLYFE